MPTLREALLPFTLRNAARLPFYATLWDGIDAATISSIAELSRLPALSKETYRRRLMFDESAVQHTEYITHTTGTTGELTWRHRSAAEASLIHQLFGRAAGKEPTGQLALVVRYNRHGMGMPMPGGTRGIPVGLDDDAELKQFVDMVGARFRFAEGALRPTVLTGSGHDLAILAQAWLESGRAADGHAIRALHLLGFVDEGLRRFLRSSFDGAEIIGKYSLAEIFGGASRRWPSTRFVLEPYVVGEVTDEDGSPVQCGGIGELTLTELFPFVQMQPLVRYRTGDIVTLVNDENDDFEFEWWGRRADCARARVDGTDSWVLGYRPIADWLSLQPLAARTTHRPGLSSVGSTDVGPPCVALSTEPDGVTVRVVVGLRVNPWWATEAVQRFARDLWAALRSMAVVPAEDVRVRLCFRHVARPTGEFGAAEERRDRTYPPAPLSTSLPLVASHGR